MERLTEHHVNKSLGAYMVCSGACIDDGFDCNNCWKLEEIVDHLAAYEDTGLEPEDVKEHEAAYIEIMTRTYGPFRQKISKWMQAEKDGRLVVLEPAAREGEKKPPCFYNDMGQALCLGFGRGEYDDEPIDRCKECWYCESTREEAEAALKKREDWTVRSEPWNCCGTMAVELERKPGGYAVDGLDLVGEADNEKSNSNRL